MTEKSYLKYLSPEDASAVSTTAIVEVPKGKSYSKYLSTAKPTEKANTGLNTVKPVSAVNKPVQDKKQSGENFGDLLLNTGKDLTMGASRASGAILTGANTFINNIDNATSELSDIILQTVTDTDWINHPPETKGAKYYTKKALEKGGHSLTNFANSEILKTPKTVTEQEISKAKNISDFANAIKNNPASSARTAIKGVAQNAGTIGTAILTGGGSLVPEMTGYATDRIKGNYQEKANALAESEYQKLHKKEFNQFLENKENLNKISQNTFKSLGIDQQKFSNDPTYRKSVEPKVNETYNKYIQTVFNSNFEAKHKNFKNDVANKYMEQNYNTNKAKNDEVALKEGVINAVIENKIGDLPVINKLLKEPVSKDARKYLVDVMNRGTKGQIIKGAVKDLGNFTGSVLKNGVFGEAVIEEGSQQAVSNIADNLTGIKTPIEKGVLENIAMASLSGPLMVGGGQVISHYKNTTIPVAKRADMALQQIQKEKQQLPDIPKNKSLREELDKETENIINAFNNYQERQGLIVKVIKENPTLTKEEIEKLVQEQMIVPDNTPDFSQPTETENRLNKQDMYNELFKDEYKPIEYPSVSPEQLLGKDNNPEVNQAIAGEYQAQADLFDEYQGELENVLAYYPSLGAFKAKVIEDHNNGVDSEELNIYRNLLQYENYFNEKGIEHHNLVSIQPESIGQSTDPLNNDVNPVIDNVQPVQEPINKYHLRFSGNTYNPMDEANKAFEAEYYQPNTQPQNVPEPLSILAEIAQQYPSWKEFRKAINNEGQAESVRKEVRKYGYESIKQFYNDRDKIKPIYAEIPDFNQDIPENNQPENINQEELIPAEIQPAQEEVAHIQAVENINKEIEKRKIKKAEKRREELLNKATDEDITPDEANELVNTEIALQNIKNAELQAQEQAKNEEEIIKKQLEQAIIDEQQAIQELDNIAEVVNNVVNEDNFINPQPTQDDLSEVNNSEDANTSENNKLVAGNTTSEKVKNKEPENKFQKEKQEVSDKEFKEKTSTTAKGKQIGMINVDQFKNGQQILVDTSALNNQATVKDEIKKETETVSETKIEDFGEKLEGAKKDLWKDYQKTMSEELPEDAKDITLSKHFPKPNYELMIEQGISVKKLAIVQAIRDLIPNKPSITHKLNSWGKTVKLAHSLANDIINSKLSTAELISVIKSKGYEFRNIPAKVELYIELGYPAFTVPNKYELRTFTSTVYDDKVLAIYNKYKGQVFNEDQAEKRDKEIADVKAKYPSEKVTEYAITDGRIIVKKFDTREKAVNYLREILIDKSENKQAKTVKLDIYQIRATKEIIIGKNVSGRKYIDLKSGFASTKEARQYLQENEKELLDLLEKKKDIQPQRREVNSPRVGEDYRKNTDISPENFSKKFGFRGVQFGNYVEQDKRGQDLNNAYDALIDLSNLIGIPSEAISLAGKLGLAFGARGAGGKHPASAHYEPDQTVINLTKKNGAGSLAHEWWHALDNFFGKQNKGRMLTEIPYKRQEASISPEVTEAFNGVMQAIRKTALVKRSSNIDKRRTKDYFSTDIEISARCFEAYLITSAKEQGLSNDYLANVIDEDAHKILNEMIGSKEDDYAYPTREEQITINPMFDKLFEVIRKDNVLATLLDNKTTEQVEEIAKNIDNKENALFKKRSGRMYIGQISSFSEIKDRVIKSFEALKPAWNYFLKYGFDPRRYFIAKAMGNYHIVEGRKIQVESNTPILNDTFKHQDLFSRMKTILQKNPFSWNVYNDAHQMKRDFAKAINNHKELLLNLEHGLGNSLSEVVDVIEGTKKTTNSNVQKWANEMKKATDEQGTRVLNALMDFGYLKPKTEIVSGKPTQVYTPDGKFIGEAYGKKEVDKIFREYMHANWKKENYFPHVFKGFYPVIAELKEKDSEGNNKTHFIGRAYTKSDAERVYNQYLEDSNNQYKEQDFTGKITLDTEYKRDESEYVLVGLPDLKKIKDKLNDEDSEFDLSFEEITEIQSLFVPKRDVKKARKTGFAERREDFEGYIKDPIEAYEAYFYGTEKFIQDATFLKKVSSNMAKAKLSGAFTKQKNLMEQTIAYAKAVTGDRYADEKAIADFTKWLFEAVIKKPNVVNYNWYSRVNKNIRGFEYKAKLGFRLDHLLIQPALLLTNVFPELSAKSKNILDGEKYTGIGIKKSVEFFFDDKMKEVLKDSQIFDVGFIESMEGNFTSDFWKKVDLAKIRFKSGNTKKGIKAGLEIAGDLWMATFALGDKLPRSVAFWGRFQQIMDDKGYKTIEEAEKAGTLKAITREAADFSDYTNFKYSVEDAPAVFRSQTGKTLLQFKQFVVFQLGLWKDMAMRDLPMIGRAIAKKDFNMVMRSTPLAKSMLMAFLIFGLTGIPFAKDLSFLFEKMFGSNPVAEATNKSEFARAGVPSLFGIDLTSSGDVTLSGLVPVELGNKWIVKVDRISPVFSTAKNLTDMANSMGNGVDEAVEEATKREFPTYRRFKEGTFGFKSSEKGKEQFKQFEYSKYNSRKMKQLINIEARRGIDSPEFEKQLNNILNSGYYADSKSFKAGYSRVKNNIISNELDKAAEAFKKDDANTMVNELVRVANKWYDGDIEQAKEKLKRKIN